MNKSIIKPTSPLGKFRFASFYFAAALIASALLGLFTHGLNLGLDFTGGYLTEFSTEQTVSQSTMQQLLDNYLSSDFQLSAADNGTHWSVRQSDINTSPQASNWLAEFAQESDLTITPQDAIYIGSQVGDELIEQGGLALLTAVIVILVYLSLRFEWRLAAGSVVALVHDVVIVLGIFAWFNISFDLTILASLLAIIGYSLNDSIIVGDKIREIIMRNKDGDIDSIINLAIKSTWVRTLITSGTTLATVLAIGLFAGESLTGFALALFCGILVGTYSSIAISATIPQLLGLRAEHYHQQVQDICTLP